MGLSQLDVSSVAARCELCRTSHTQCLYKDVGLSQLVQYLCEYLGYRIGVGQTLLPVQFVMESVDRCFVWGKKNGE